MGSKTPPANGLIASAPRKCASSSATREKSRRTAHCHAPDVLVADLHSRGHTHRQRRGDAPDQSMACVSERVAAGQAPLLLPNTGASTPLSESVARAKKS